MQNVARALKLIEDVHHAHPHNHEVIFVDDQSTDGTVAEIEKLIQKKSKLRLLRSPERKGLGHALKQGLRSCEGSMAFFLDCDVSIEKEDVLKILKASTLQKMVIGSRYVLGAKIIGASRTKILISYGLNRLIGRYHNLPAIDISHSLRLFPVAPILEHLPENDTHPAFFWELSLTAIRQGLQICEVPITFRERLHGQSKNAMNRMARSVLKGLKTAKQLKTQSNSRPVNT